MQVYPCVFIPVWPHTNNFIVYLLIPGWAGPSYGWWGWYEKSLQPENHHGEWEKEEEEKEEVPSTRNCSERR